MCNPLIFMVALTAVSAYGSAQTQKQTAKYQAAVAENNQKAAEWQAQDAVQRGNAAADQARRKGTQTLGSQRAAMAAAGLDISTGSALSILEDTDYFNQVDQATIRDNAAREAWGYKVQANNSAASAQMYNSTASNINPLFEGVKAGVGSYYAGGGGKSGGTTSPGTNASYLGQGGQVDSTWYGGRTLRG